VLLDEMVRPEAFPTGLVMSVWTDFYAISE